MYNIMFMSRVYLNVSNHMAVWVLWPFGMWESARLILMSASCEAEVTATQWFP